MVQRKNGETFSPYVSGHGKLIGMDVDNGLKVKEEDQF